VTRTIGDFWREWPGLPKPAKPPDTGKFATERIPTVPAERTLRIGDNITCDQPTGVFRRCLCGCTTFTVQESKGHHAAQLICNRCRRGGR
jgi:hypothetical protein